MRWSALALLSAAAACTNPGRTTPPDAGSPIKTETATTTKAALEFGERGIAIGPTARAHAFVRAPNGRIIVAGETAVERDASRAILACFLADGTLAHDFGVRGVFELARESKGQDKINDAFYAVAIDHQGRIVAAGKTGEGDRSKALLARVLPDGTLDQSFAPKRGFLIGTGEEFLDDGFANVPPEKAIPDERFLAVAIDEKGRVLAAGSTGDRGKTWLSKSKVCGLLPSSLCHGSFRSTLLARFTDRGELDTSFQKVGYTIGNGEGRPWLSFPHDELTAITVLSDGSVVALGFAGTGSEAERRSLWVTYRENGAIDQQRFGPERAHAGGKREELHAISSAADAKLIAAGASFDEKGLAHALISRHTNNGSFDLTFAEAGFVVDETGVRAPDVKLSAAPVPNGVVIGVGTRLTRFSGSGAIDRAFKASWTETSSASIAGVLFDPATNRLMVTGNIGERAYVARIGSSGCLDDPRAPCER